MARHKASQPFSSLDELRRLRLAELEVDYRKQLRKLKDIIKHGRIGLDNRPKNKQ